MNTTTNTTLTLSILGSRNLRKQGATLMSKKAGHKGHSKICPSRWPVKTSNTQSVTNPTTATNNNYKYSNSDMKTLNTRKFAFVTLGFLAVVLLGTALINEKGLAEVGEYIGYVAALAILAIGAMDNTRTKKLV